MLAMHRPIAAVRPRALSAATALAFGGGLALYQMTSLVLGPAGTRELHLSLSMPMVEASERAEPVAPSADLALGSAAPAVVARAGTVASTRHRAAVTPATTAAPLRAITVSPVPSATPRPSARPLPTAPPLPDAPGDDESD